MNLYVTDHGSYLHIKNNRIVVEKNEECLREIPIEKVEAIMLLNSVQVSSQLIIQLLQRGIPLTWLSSSGAFYGRLVSTKHVNVERHARQFKLADDREFCLEISRKLIYAKVHNQLVLLERAKSNMENEAVEKTAVHIEYLGNKILSADKIDEIMGYEGNAARLYYSCVTKFLPDDVKFYERNRQPPKDAFNSMLSFGYTLLLYEIYTALLSKGLHPYCAFLHRFKQGHPALASDMIEEWRAVLVDSLVLKLLCSKSFEINDFDVDSENGGVYLNSEKRKDFIEEFEKKIQTPNKYLSYLEYPVSYRDAFSHQAAALAAAIEEHDAALYKPVMIR